MKLSPFVLVFFTIVITSCASPYYQPILTDEDKIDIGRLRVVSLVRQEGIESQYMPIQDARNRMSSHGAVGALIGWAADSVANKKRIDEVEKSLLPFRKSLLDFDIKGRIHTAMANHVFKVGYDVSDFVTDSEGEEFIVSDFTKDFSGENLLVIDTCYSFSPRKNVIHLTSDATLYMKTYSKNNKAYKTIKWSVVYQTPARVLFYSPLDELELGLVVEQLKASYIDKIEKVRRSKKLAMKMERDEKVSALGRGLFVEHDVPMMRSGWVKNVLVKELSRGAESVASELFKAFSGSRDMSEREKIKIPYGYGSEEPYSLLQVSLVGEGPDSGFVTYLGDKNTKYILPTDEIMQAKMPLAVSEKDRAASGKR